MNRVKSFTQNTEGKDYVVGDIHGCFTKLECELYTLGFDETKDRLFSVGDLVDRGAESEKVIEWLQKSWFHAVRGNHEQMAIDAPEDDFSYKYWHCGNGGEWYYSLFEQDRKEIVEAFKDLPYMIEIVGDGKVVGITHAEVPAYSWENAKSIVQSGEANSLEKCLWARQRIKSKETRPVEGVDVVYVGHTPMHEVTTLGNVIYVDTGAVYAEGRLTILEIKYD